MTRFVVGDDRSQSTLFPERLDDYLGEDNPVRAVDVLSMSLIWRGSASTALSRGATGRPAYHPATLLKIYVYGVLGPATSCCPERLGRWCRSYPATSSKRRSANSGPSRRCSLLPSRNKSGVPFIYGRC